MEDGADASRVEEELDSYGRPYYVHGSGEALWNRPTELKMEIGSLCSSGTRMTDASSLSIFIERSAGG